MAECILVSTLLSRSFRRLHRVYNFPRTNVQHILEKFWVRLEHSLQIPSRYDVFLSYLHLTQCHTRSNLISVSLLFCSLSHSLSLSPSFDDVEQNAESSGHARLNPAEVEDFYETCIAFYCRIDHLNNSQNGESEPSNILPLSLFLSHPQPFFVLTDTSSRLGWYYFLYFLSLYIHINTRSNMPECTQRVCYIRRVFSLGHTPSKDFETPLAKSMWTEPSEHPTRPLGYSPESTSS